MMRQETFYEGRSIVAVHAVEVLGISIVLMGVSGRVKERERERDFLMTRIRFRSREKCV